MVPPLKEKKTQVSWMRVGETLGSLWDFLNFKCMWGHHSFIGNPSL